MGDIKILIFFILVPLTSVFSYTIIDNDNVSLSLYFYSQTSLFWDYDAETSNKEDVIAFNLDRNVLGFKGEYKNIQYALLAEYTTFQYDSSFFFINEASLRYRFNKTLAVEAGYIKIPYGRSRLDSDSELLLYKQNDFGNINSHLGVASELSFDDNKYVLNLAVYNNYDFVRPGTDFEPEYGAKFLDYCGSFHFMPFGNLDNSESAAKGYEKFLIDIVPCMKTFSLDRRIDSGYKKTTDLYYGLQTAGRYSHLALDASIYSHIKDHDTEKYNYLMYSAQMGYAFWGKIEPSVRFTSRETGYFVSTPSHPVSTYNDYTLNLFECGVSYYLDKNNSKVGFYYSTTTYDYKGVELDLLFEDKDDVRLFIAFTI